VWSNAGIITWSTPELHVIGNTMYDVDAGFLSPGGGTQSHHVWNNIISDLAEPAYHAAILVSGVAGASSLGHNVLHEPGGTARLRWGTSTVHDLPSFQAAFPGQGQGCTEADPLLLEPPDDLRLRSGSSADGAADTARYTDCYQVFEDLYGIGIRQDFAGVARPTDGAHEIGAYELAPPGSVFQVVASGRTVPARQPLTTAPPGQARWWPRERLLR
jgi:hypothetical protein